ncbi:MAG TPA: hypothetical protein VKY59_01495 [Spirillospora sp.]|nr:hypothetical protein [Spirillospora sp.]
MKPAIAKLAGAVFALLLAWPAQAQTVTRVATNLENPRGIAVLPDGRLLVVEAGTGFDTLDPLQHTGKLSLFEDLNGDGDYDDPGEITRIFSFLPSYNTLTRYNTGHDEIGGPGDIIVLDDGRIFITRDEAFDGIAIVEINPDYRVRGDLITAQGTINALAYDAGSGIIYAAESGLNRLSAVTLDGNRTVVADFAPLAHNQQAVPSGLALDPRTGELLVALFSGQVIDYYGTTLSFMPGDAKIVRVDPATGAVRDEITGLTTAVDVAVDAAGNLFVVELTTRWPPAHMPRQFDLFDPDAPPDDGGYARYSGRVTLYAADGRAPVILADGLDQPTNITYHDGVLYISAGQGTPGRPIIGPNGRTSIVGEIYRITDYLPEG